MTLPRLGYLCLAENPSSEAGRALVRQFVLVREADRMGFDDIWLGEQHTDSHWPTPGILSLLGHLAAVTSKARIGSLAMLPALHPSQTLAEELATLDLLSKGRLEWGVASGAAFAGLLAAHGLSANQARARLLQQVDATLATLAASPATATDAFAATAVASAASANTTDAAAIYSAEPATPWMPAGQQRPLPVCLAADDPASLDHAARRGWGLVAAATHSRARIQAACARYAATAGRPPALTLARFACSADSRDQALAIATPYFEAVARRAAIAGWGADPARSMAQNVPALIAQSLVGSHAEVAAMIQALGAPQGAAGLPPVARLAIVPTSGQFDTHKHILAAFVDEVRPLLDD